MKSNKTGARPGGGRVWGVGEEEEVCTDMKLPVSLPKSLEPAARLKSLQEVGPRALRPGVSRVAWSAPTYGACGSLLKPG